MAYKINNLNTILQVIYYYYYYFNKQLRVQNNLLEISMVLEIVMLKITEFNLETLPRKNVMDLKIC